MASIGFCFGGRASFIAATGVGGLAASVCFYGAGIAPENDHTAPIHLAHQIACPVLAIYGAADPMISPEEIERIRAALEATGSTHIIKVYDGAGHGFCCDARPAAYHAEAAADAWQVALDFLAAATTTPTSGQ